MIQTGILTEFIQLTDTEDNPMAIPVDKVLFMVQGTKDGKEQTQIHLKGGFDLFTFMTVPDICQALKRARSGA